MVRPGFFGSLHFWLAMSAAPCAWWVLWAVFAMPVTGARTVTLSVLLMTIVVYPVLEEIVFRGALQGWLLGFVRARHRILGISLANLVTSLVFTALHFINHPPLWAALVLLPSFVFGWARERFDSILPAIVLHIFYNAGFILLFA